MAAMLGASGSTMFLFISIVSTFICLDGYMNPDYYFTKLKAINETKGCIQMVLFFAIIDIISFYILYIFYEPL